MDRVILLRNSVTTFANNMRCSFYGPHVVIWCILERDIAEDRRARVLVTREVIAEVLFYRAWRELLVEFSCSLLEFLS